MKITPIANFDNNELLNGVMESHALPIGRPGRIVLANALFANRFRKIDLAVLSGVPEGTLDNYLEDVRTVLQAKSMGQIVWKSFRRLESDGLTPHRMNECLQKLRPQYPPSAELTDDQIAVVDGVAAVGGIGEFADAMDMRLSTVKNSVYRAGRKLGIQATGGALPQIYLALCRLDYLPLGSGVSERPVSPERSEATESAAYPSAAA